jgi:hypothetical protein
VRFRCWPSSPDGRRCGIFPCRTGRLIGSG